MAEAQIAQFSVNLDEINEKIDRVLDALNKKAERVNKSIQKTTTIFDKIGKVVNFVVIKPFKMLWKIIDGVLKGIGKIWRFLKKIASLTFGNLLKVFGLMWLWTKLSTLMGLNAHQYQGTGAGTQGTQHRALERAETMYGTGNTLQTVMDNMKNIINNPQMHSISAQLGVKDLLPQLNNMEVGSASFKYLNEIIDRARTKTNTEGDKVFDTNYWRTVIQPALEQIGLSTNQLRGYVGVAQPMEADYNRLQKARISGGMLKVERAYHKLNFAMQDLTQRIMVTFSPVILNLGNWLVKLGHKLVDLITNNENFKNLLGMVNNALDKFFTWLSTDAYKDIKNFIDKTGEKIKGFVEWTKEIKETDGFETFINTVDFIVEVFKRLGSIIMMVVDILKLFANDTILTIKKIQHFFLSAGNMKKSGLEREIEEYQKRSYELSDSVIKNFGEALFGEGGFDGFKQQSVNVSGNAVVDIRNNGQHIETVNVPLYGTSEYYKKYGAPPAPISPSQVQNESNAIKTGGGY